MLLSSKKQSPLMNGLISHWKLDELTGDRYDSRGGKTLLPVGVVQYNVGKMGNCASFNGDAGVYLSSASYTSLTDIDWSLGFTVAGWFYYPTAFNSYFHVLAKQYGGNADWGLGLSAPNACRFYVNDSVSGQTLAVSPTTVVADTWYFLAGRYNPVTKKAEVSLNNAAFTVGTALTNVPKNLRTHFEIGRYASSYGASRLDGVNLWTRYVTDAEITQIYNNGNGLEYPFMGETPIEATEWYSGTDWYVSP